MAEKKKVTIVTRKKKAGKATSPGAADASSPEAGAKVGARKTVPKPAASKKKSGLLPGLPSLPDLLDFPAGVAEGAREVWMAGIGALSTVEEVGGALFQSLVQKGESWEEASRKKLTAASKTAGAAVEGAKATAGSLSQMPLAWSEAVEAQVQRVVEDSVEGVLHRLNVPTHDEVQDLIARVGTLTGKVDALTQQMHAARAEGAAPPAPKAVSASKAASASKATPSPKATPSASDDAPVYHVVPHEEGWAVEREGASRATSVHSTKSEATAAGRERAKAAAAGRLVLHRQDGTIQDAFSYGE